MFPTMSPSVADVITWLGTSDCAIERTQPPATVDVALPSFGPTPLHAPYARRPF